MGDVWCEAAGPEDGPLVVLVHGSMDRSAGLLKLSRRLDDRHRVVRYDRRGYGRSAGAGGPFDLRIHVADLGRLLDGRRAVIFGHSYGGNVALGLAAANSELVQAVAVYETPLSWMDWWPTTTAGGDALTTDGGVALDSGAAAERFMRRLIGDARWERLPARTRAARRAEGEAMIVELDDLRQRAPWDPVAVTVPVVAMRGADGADHHRRSTAHLGQVLPDCHVVDIVGARHFGPNTHPDAVAGVIAELVGRRSA